MRFNVKFVKKSKVCLFILIASIIGFYTCSSAPKPVPYDFAVTQIFGDGIYIFNWKLLRKMLVADMDDPNSNHDFGKDIIPALLNDGKRLFAYQFKGYWKDVGTVDSLWEANMDLLSKNNELDLNDPNWKIYTEDVATVPHFIGPEGNVHNAYINQGCYINGEVNNSVLFTNVNVKENAVINDSVLMPDVEVGEGAVIHRAIVMQGVKIDPGAVVGDPNSEHIELISKRVRGE